MRESTLNEEMLVGEGVRKWLKEAGRKRLQSGESYRCGAMAVTNRMIRYGSRNPPGVL